MTQRRPSFVLLGLACLIGCSAMVPSSQSLSVQIDDPTPFHVHQVGEPFKIDLKVSGSATVTYQWKDFTGAALAPAQSLTANDQELTLSSPSGETGYYGLVLTPPADRALPNRQPGESREYGFVILPQLRKQSADSAFGLVHANVKDPNMPPWVKTATWQTSDAAYWPRLLREGRRNGKIELPIIVGGAWKSDDSDPISDSQLDLLQRKAEEFFKADPSLLYWEAGIEENLGDNFHKAHYWDNLEKKFDRLHRAARNAGIDIKFIYQVVGADTPGLKSFFEHKAYRYVDILSLHPYAWPDFDGPEIWLDDLLREAARLKTAHHVPDLPIWFTEVGAPQFGNFPGGFFGYIKEKRKTGGLSRAEAVAYLTKLCLIARAGSVERIFWYNDKDASSARDEVEAHFGLRDYEAYPKPVYAAYALLARALGPTQPVQIYGLPKGVRGYKVEGKGQVFFVLWRTDGSPRDFDLRQLGQSKSFHITDAVGHGVEMKKDFVPLGTQPLFLWPKN